MVRYGRRDSSSEGDIDRMEVDSTKGSRRGSWNVGRFGTGDPSMVPLEVRNLLEGAQGRGNGGSRGIEDYGEYVENYGNERHRDPREYGGNGDVIMEGMGGDTPPRQRPPSTGSMKSVHGYDIVPIYNLYPEVAMQNVSYPSPPERPSTVARAGYDTPYTPYTATQPSSAQDIVIGEQYIHATNTRNELHEQIAFTDSQTTYPVINAQYTRITETRITETLTVSYEQNQAKTAYAQNSSYVQHGDTRRRAAQPLSRAHRDRQRQNAVVQRTTVNRENAALRAAELRAERIRAEQHATRNATVNLEDIIRYAEILENEIKAINEILQIDEISEEEMNQAQNRIKTSGLSENQETLRIAAMDRQCEAAKQVRRSPNGPKDEQIRKLAMDNTWAQLIQERSLGVQMTP